MKIGILGAGAMANAIGRRLVSRGHQLLLSFSRDRAKLELAARDLGVRAGSPREAAEFGDVVLLSTGWEGSPAALKEAGPLDGATIWSIVNPVESDLSGLAVGTTTSGSEELARLVPGAAFVAGWPPFAEILASPSTRFGSDRCALLYCGDDEGAKRKVAPLFDALDVDAIDAGPLSAARAIEPSMLMLVQLAYRRKMGQVGLRLLRRTA